jgi:hypothetical protein
MRLTYLLPIRSDSAPSTELTEYLLGLSRHVPVVVVDGSPPDVFEEAHRAWAPHVVHIKPSPQVTCLNGKVRNVLTGLAHVTTEGVVIADDDVRYRTEELTALAQALDDADLVRPQNWFDPLPWHAVWDSARILLNRALGEDFPGTLAVRTTILRSTGGYDGNVLFENLELVRTVTAAGGRCVDRADLFVRRLPPTTAHFLRQRVRQAYDELARPARFAVQLAILPGVIAVVRSPRRVVGAGVVAMLVAEVGRRRAGGPRVFTPLASVCAPLWILERGVCAWLAAVQRVRGGVPYAGQRVVRAATPQRSLNARYAHLRRSVDAAGEAPRAS